MERRFKTSNHSNEQAKRISIEASGIDKKIKGKKEKTREEKIGRARRKWSRCCHGTRVQFLSSFNCDSENADD